MQSTIGNVPAVGRRLRNPQHNFLLRAPPFAITPFLLAPVLPGETMKNLSFQARVVSKPIKNSLVGWWVEFYVFYVKHRDMKDSQLWQNMVLDPGVNVTGASCYITAATDVAGWSSAQGFHTGSGINWAQACADVVIENYFRDEGDSAGHWIYTYNAAQVNGNNWLDSVTLQATQAAVDVNVDADANTVITASEVDKAMRTYEMMVAGGLVNMSYEDWLRSFGVRQSQAAKNIPELVRYVREWTYPSSHIDPATGAASSAVSWSIAERADKDRFFAEPGFLFGVTVTRPKVYFRNMKQPGPTLMNDAYSWLPAVLRDDAASSIKLVLDSANDPVGGIATGNWYVDVKDLLLYGDQLVNFPLSAADAALIDLPVTGTLAHQYPSQTDVEGLFVTAGDAIGGIRMDGVARLSILGTQEDTTIRGSSLGTVY